MISIVVVSHSQKAAEGAVEIAQEMNMGGVRILAAGGVGDGSIGTNPTLIQAALEEVADSDAILLFADLGSAILSAEMAVEMLDPDVARKVRIVDAPVVEGTVVAAIQAGLSDDVNEIVETAEGAKLVSKVNH